MEKLTTVLHARVIGSGGEFSHLFHSEISVSDFPSLKKLLERMETLPRNTAAVLFREASNAYHTCNFNFGRGNCRNTNRVSVIVAVYKN